MTRPLSLLLVEDNEDDALLLLNELRYGGFDLKNHVRVQSEASLREALENCGWDVIISDYTMPGFDGLRALAMVRESCQDIPFILISGMIGEETAVAALKAGANDYLLKDRLSRLPKAVQKELDDAHQRRKLREVQHELVKAKAAADLANQRKSQVLAFVAHEFKNPLQAITLFSDLMQDQMYGAINDRQQGCVRNIQMATQHLKNLVNDILDIAAIEAGQIKLNVSGFNLNEMLDNVLVLTREMANQQAINIVLHNHAPDLIIHGDERRLRQVFINLISNAIKYSPKNTLITLDVDQPAAKPGDCHVKVMDQGVGMSADELNQLFREFYRVQKSAHIEGVGLGLALTKTLVELHKGHIDVVSEQGKGSTFTVVLPLQQTT
jgi:signal transduction histidine kinase